MAFLNLLQVRVRVRNSLRGERREERREGTHNPKGNQCQCRNEDFPKGQFLISSPAMEYGPTQQPYNHRQRRLSAQRTNRTVEGQYFFYEGIGFCQRGEESQCRAANACCHERRRRGTVRLLFFPCHTAVILLADWLFNEYPKTHLVLLC